MTEPRVEAGDRALETAREIHDAAHGCGDTVEHMAALIQSAMNAETQKLEAELSLVDEALSRRPALADIPYRYNKIFAACAAAAKVDAMNAQERGTIAERIADLLRDSDSRARSIILDEAERLLAERGGTH